MSVLGSTATGGVKGQDGQGPRRRSFRLGVILAALAGLVVRLWAVATVDRVDPTGGDGFYYHTQANLLAHGKWFVDPYRVTASGGYVQGNAHPPLYTVWLSISSFLGGTDYRAHKTMSCLAGVLLVVGIGLLARELAGRRAGVIAAVLAAVYPPFWIIGGLLMPEELYAAIVSFLLLAVCRWRRRPSWPSALGAGALLALAALTRAEAMAFSLLLIAPVMLLPGPLTMAWRRRVGHLVLAGIACAAVIAPWVIRNAVSFNQFQPFSTNGDELFVYANNPITYGTNDTPIVCSRTVFTDADQRAGKRIEPQGTKYLGYWYFPWEQYLRCEHGEPPGDPSDKSMYWRKQGIDYLREHKGRLPVVMAARVGRVWEVFRPFQNADFGRVEGRTLWVSELGLFVYWSLLAASIPGLVALRRRRVPIWPLLSTAAVVTITVIYAYGNERFRLPLDVGIVVGAAVAIDALLRRWRPVGGDVAGPHEALRGSVVGDGSIVEVRPTPPGAHLRRWGAALRRWPWRDLAMWAVVAVVLALPFRGLMHSPGGPMEEGFMLTFPERILHGDLPNRDFLHLYGPGSLWSLASVYWLFGTSLATERFFGALQVAGIAAGVAWLLRPFGRFLAGAGAVVSLVVVLPALGFTALAWNGGVALLLLAVGLARGALPVAGRAPEVSSAEHQDEVDGSTRPVHLRRLGLAGVVAGFALLFRPDLALAVLLVGGGLLWGRPRAALKRAVAGLLLGVSPILLHLATAGPGHVVKGMFIEPVFRLRGGRTLPIPPSWNELEVFLQRLAGFVPMPWPFPHPKLASEVALLFWLVPVIALVVGASGLRALRRQPSSERGRALLLGGLLAFGMLPQAFQRADVPHFTWASCVSFGFLPAAIASLLAGRATVEPRRLGAWRSVAASGVVAVILLCGVPLLTARPYVELVKQSAGGERVAWSISRNGRNFPYGSQPIAAAGNQLVKRLDQMAKPGQRLFVGPDDLRKTPYSQAFWYFLYPDLVPATYYIELDPWLANRPGSRLASDVASADWLILTSIGSGWDEPNLSRRVGSDAPNEVVRRDFCKVDSFGQEAGSRQAIWTLYGRCDRVRPRGTT